MKSFKLSRRAVLRGAGVTIALPTLDAMLDDRGFFHRTAFAQPAAPPVRLVTFFLPNGFPPGNRFVPASTGAGYKLTPCLEPIKDFVSDCTILSGLNGPKAYGRNAHSEGTTGFSTGLPCTTAGADGPSVDQVAGRRQGGATKFPALVVGVQNTNLPNLNGYSANIKLSTSWAGPRQSVPPEFDPNTLFQKLFGKGVPQQDAATFTGLREQRKSVLDHVTTEIEGLKGKVGADDRARLDAQLTGIRELERRLPFESAQPAASCTAPKMGAAPSGFFAKALLQVDLLAMALQCNLTKYASFIHSCGSGNGGSDPALGLTAHQHSLAHAGNQDGIQRYTVAQMRVVARFLERLKAGSEGGRPVLYNTIVMVGTELGNGTNHSMNGLPFVIAGHAGGRLKTIGKHIRPQNAPRVGKLLFTLLRMAGVNESSFAGETQSIPELVG
jgi:hypothetical protein